VTRARAVAALLGALAFASCAGETPDPVTDPAPETEDRSAAPGQRTDAAPAPQSLPDAPHVYMAIQPGPAGAVSVIFAIDEARDGTPLDDPAIRITPENGRCNPQELRRHDFPAERAATPVFGPRETLSGVTARDLPNFMAMAATLEMMRLRLIARPDESRPQNVCTRKLWERLIVARSGG